MNCESESESMTLDIVVTHYQEPWEIVKPLFDSLKLQKGYNPEDVQILLVNDGKEGALDKNLFADFPIKVKTYEKKKEGISAARNFGLKHSKADYIMWCDCDDMFINSFGLHLIFSAMNECYDAITSVFIEEHKEKGKYHIIRKERDATFVHGKVYRREYLKELGLEWNEKLTIHEDSYFNGLAITMTANRKEITTPFYMWCYREDSVADKASATYVMRTYGDLMMSRKAMCDTLEKFGCIDERYNLIVKTILDAYYDFQKPNWLAPENESYVLLAKSAFKTFYIIFRNEYNECNIQRISEMMMACRLNAYNCGMRVEQETVHDFLEGVMRE